MSSIKQYLKLQRAALVFLDQTETFNSILEQCSRHTNSKNVTHTYHFNLLIDPSELVDLDVSLGNAFLNHPIAATKVFQEVVFTIVVTSNLLPCCASPAQIVVHLKATHLPSIDSYQLKAPLIQSRCIQSGLYHLGGVISSSSMFRPYTKSARFVCPQEGCPGAECNEFFRVHIPGASERQTIRKDFRCTYCCTLLEEDVSCRVLADMIVVNIIDEGAFLYAGTSSKRFQATRAFLRDEMAAGIEIGQAVSLVGIPQYDDVHRDTYFEVNNIIQCEQDANQELDNRRGIQDLSETIQYLYKDRANSPWGFTMSLAYAFGSNVSAAGTFLHLKLGLLLSLVSCLHSQEQTRLELLAVASDTLLLHRLLQYAGTFSPRFIEHGATKPLTTQVYKDSSGLPMIDGGSLLLAHSGVCLVPHLGVFKNKERQTLRQVMETKKIVVEVPGEASYRIFLPLSCQVWAISELPQNSQIVSIGKPPSSNGDSSYQDQQCMRQLDQNLVGMFGMVYVCDMEADSYPEYMTVHQTLMSALSCEPTPLISDKDFTLLLDCARRHKVCMSDEAETLIKGYYIASRKFQRSSLHPSPLPQTAISTISSLACNHAKLRLADEISEEDAVLAILHYEESVSFRFGPSQLHVNPMDHIKDNNLQAYIGPERVMKIQAFHKQLKQFIEVHGCDTDFLEE